ncbi:glycosyltransferase [Priestia flexa]|uniref:glycosyltransferase n=1 Tax=Priestia flexa TaxID=86664 RepID=UPI000C241566|nr:glycosyltransferase [Priestia flexa]MEC0666415.1 glycosyltransferase [Priestia flexa]
MDLSIILPVYNVEPYLSSCLNSIFQKKEYSFEVIAINDGSTDNSLKILEEYKAKFSNLTVISQKNSGPSVARNKGLAKAKGNYIYFFDSDDILHDSINLISLSQNTDVDIITFNAEVFKDNENNILESVDSYKEPRVIYKINQSKYVNNIQLVNYSGMQYFDIIRKVGSYTPVVWRKIYKKSFLQDYNLEFHPNIIAGEDDLHFIQTLLCNPKILHYNQSVVLHRIRGTSLMGSLNRQKKYDSFYTVLLELINLRSKYNRDSDEFKHVEWAINVFFRKLYYQNPKRLQIYNLLKFSKKNKVRLNLKTILRMSMGIIMGK